jgi:hypothetical protein
VSLSEAWLLLPPKAMIRAYNNPRVEIRDYTDTALAKARRAPNPSESTVRLFEAMKVLEPIGARQSAQSAAETALKRWIIWALKTGKYTATGYPVENGKAALVPATLPLFMFEERTALNHKFVDWGLSTVRRAGHEFISVQVHVPDRFVGSAGAAPSSGVSELAERALTEATLAGSARRKGRRSNAPILRSLVRRLHEAGMLKGLTAKEQDNLIAKVARAEHSDLFPKPSQPSRSKIIEAMQAEGVRRRNAPID